MEKITILLLILFLTSCNNTNTELEKELASVKSELEKAKKELISFQSPPQNILVHEVYLNLKDDLSENQIQSFMDEIQKLKTISEIKKMRIGGFENLDDPRALSDFEMIMVMDFANKKDYKTYQEHPLHLGLKEALKIYLEAPPATYDYITK